MSPDNLMSPDDLLRFWFGDDPGLWRPAPWFVRDEAFDSLCRERFAAAWTAARAGRIADWQATPEGALALAILLDQIPRNIHRGTPAAFATDPAARATARAAMRAGHPLALTAVQRVFLYLPFEHSEDLPDQALSVQLFETLRGTPAEPAVDYAHRHRDVIRRFGRFPHRNAILGRASTPEELDYLAEPGSGF